MSNATWVIADPHFGHANICKFVRNDGSKLRPWDDVGAMDDEMVRRWNAVVQPHDRVYVMGDVVINRKALPIFSRLNGRKALIKGNHDIFKLSDYLPYFDDIRAYCVGHKTNGNDERGAEKRKYIISHIPVHPESLGRFGINIHGHLHDHVVHDPLAQPTDQQWPKADPRYVCVSAEQINYTPILLSKALERAA